MDYPRYSVGYSALWNVLGITVETHMLKPYKERVEGTYELMKSMIDLSTKMQRLLVKHVRKMKNTLHN